MKKSKALLLLPFQFTPVFPRFFQQGECPVDMRVDKLLRPKDRTIYMTLGCKVYHRTGAVLRKDSFEQLTIANIAMDELMTGIVLQRS